MTLNPQPFHQKFDHILSKRARPRAAAAAFGPSSFLITDQMPLLLGWLQSSSSVQPVQTVPRVQAGSRIQDSSVASKNRATDKTLDGKASEHTCSAIEREAVGWTDRCLQDKAGATGSWVLPGHIYQISTPHQREM